MKTAAKRHLLRDRVELAVHGWDEIEAAAFQVRDPDVMELAIVTGALMAMTLRRAQELDDDVEDVFVCEIDESAGLREAAS